MIRSWSSISGVCWLLQEQNWDVMTVENRGRLVRAVVQRVEVDERSGQVTAELVDLATAELAEAIA